MLRFSKRILIYGFTLILLSMSISGCNKEDAADQATEESDDGKVSDDQALADAVASALSGGAENQDEPGNQDTGDVDPAASGASVEPVNTAIAERSPVEITRIEVPDDPDDEDDIAEEKDPHEHEVTPNLFPVEKCQVEVNGIYQVKLSKDLLKEVNKRRADRKIGSLTENTGLDACADARCKEQTYFIGHFRPDGSAFDSVGRGYIQGECIAVDYRTVNDIMEAWFAVNESRYQIMNPDYTQCGISIYDIDGIYYIAMEFGW